MAYDLYPAVDPSYNFPPEVRAALATSTELRNTVVPMTTTLRNNLTAGEKWDGRLILNTTTDRLERWDTGLAGWQQIADQSDVVAGDTVNQNLRTKNRIINGDFAVNQRAATSTSTIYEFVFDRWSLSFAGGTVTYSAQNAALGDLPESAKSYARLVTAGQSAAGDYANLAQRIEYVRSLSGKTVTVSFWAKAATGTPKVAVDLVQAFGTGGTPSSSVITYAGVVTLSTSWTRYSVTAAVPSIAGKTIGTSGTDAITINLWTSAGTTHAARTGSMGIQSATIDFWGVQVEEGSVATPFEIEQYGDNLRRCQRYYYRHVTGNSQTIGVGVALTASEIDTTITLPVSMRVKPTIDAANASTYFNSAFSGTFNTFFLDSKSSNTVAHIYSSVPSVSMSTNLCGLLFTNNAASYLGFNAEL